MSNTERIRARRAAFCRLRKIALCSMALNLLLAIALTVSICTRPKTTVTVPTEVLQSAEPVQSKLTQAVSIKQTELTSLGTYTVTAYCACEKCCGEWSAQHKARQGTDYIQRTASGTIPTAGRTVAADTSVLPFGTVIVIDGHEFTVEDRGGGVNGKQIDIFFDSHEDALNWGRQTKTIYIKGDK